MERHQKNKGYSLNLTAFHEKVNQRTLDWTQKREDRLLRQQYEESMIIANQKNKPTTLVLKSN